jgi:hypothetical protein
MNHWNVKPTGDVHAIEPVDRSSVSQVLVVEMMEAAAFAWRESLYVVAVFIAVIGFHWDMR